MGQINDVFEMIKWLGNGGCSINDIMVHTGLNKNQVRSCIQQCQKLGWICTAGREKREIKIIREVALYKEALYEGT